MADRFADHAPSLESPALHGFAVSPNDGTDLQEVTRAIYVGGSGSLTLVFPSSAEITFAGLAGGTVLPVRAMRIKATGTTATAIVGLI